jgi:replication-associated recombination protein RarA
MDKETFFSNIINTKQYNINNKYNSYINNLCSSSNVQNIPNLILYGPPGVGKYCEALKIIQYFSPSKLKYEKKMVINSIKNDHIIKISDIHYEINVENLTCISKQLFNDIYKNIIDSIESSQSKQGIILIKNFHVIDDELLEVFYSYMQLILNSNITIKYIILTEHISFINKNILDISEILYYNKLTKSNIFKKLKNKKSIINIKQINDNTIANLNNKICDNLVYIILNNNIDYNVIRNLLYDLLIYNLNVNESIFYIIENIITLKTDLNNDFISKIFFKTCEFFKYFNNNYRPIYHMENYILYIVDLIHNN